MATLRVDVAIVGGGPRGVSVVERLAAHRPAGTDPVRVALIDAIEVGSGATWRTDQPPAFLNNTQAAFTTILPDEHTPVAPPLPGGVSLIDWARSVRQGEGRPDWVLEEAASLAPDVYPTRRLQGQYFREQLDRIEATGRVAVQRLTERAVRIESDTRRSERQAIRLESGAIVDAAVVVLAQGMIQARPTGDVAAFAAAARERGLLYFPPGMPAERDWDRVPGDGESVLVRGLGANFFDVFPVLTQDRGGRFERVDGRLRYVPSGREPILYAGSRRGLPYRSKPYFPGGFAPPYRTRFATPDWFGRLPWWVDFRRDVWPQIVRELAWAHVTTLAEHWPGALRVTPDAIEPVLARVPLAEVDALLATAIADPRWTFTVTGIDRPPAAAQPFEEDVWRTWVGEYVKTERAAIHDPLRHPRIAVNRAVNATRRQVKPLVYQGRFTGESAVHDVLGWFDAFGLGMASGPPPQRTEEALALIEAGVIGLIGPDATFTVHDDQFVASSPAVRRPPIKARAFIETRMSKGKVAGTDDPLLADLLVRGEARLFRFANPSGPPTASASLDVSTEGLRLRAEDGSESPRVYVLGIPAEAVQPETTVGPSPGARSTLFIHTDRVAAEALALIGAHPERQPVVPAAREPSSSPTEPRPDDKKEISHV
jgi:hypothetical protein